MISEEYILKLVKDYASSPEGKATIKKKYGIDYEETLPKARLKAYGEKMKDILFQYISEKIKSIVPDDIIVGEPFKDNEGKVHLKISFKDGSLRRDSLYIDEYPNGLDNIVLLFAHGYHAKDYVYGWWDRPNKTWYGGNDFANVRSRKTLESSDFLNNAVSEFNNISGGYALAEIEEKYN